MNQDDEESKSESSSSDDLNRSSGKISKLTLGETSSESGSFDQEDDEEEGEDDSIKTEWYGDENGQANSFRTPSANNHRSNPSFSDTSNMRTTPKKNLEYSVSYKNEVKDLGDKDKGMMDCDL